MNPHLGKYKITGLLGQWLFWSFSSEDGLACFVAESFPVVPENIYDAQEVEAAEAIHAANFKNPNREYVIVPIRYVQDSEPDDSILYLF